MKLAINWEIHVQYYWPFIPLLDAIPHPGGGGTCKNSNRDACPTFLGLKSGPTLLFWVARKQVLFFEVT